MPVVAWAVARLGFAGSPDIAAGMVLEFLVPTASAGFAWIAICGGDLTLGLVAVFVDAVLTPVLLPFGVEFLTGAHVSVDSGELMRSMVVMVLAPSVLAVVFNEAIRLEKVSFRYAEEWVLRDVDLTIRKGQTVALVGHSGSGKSTLVDLIPRFYDVVEGCITIDGTDIREVAVADLRRLMGNVNQEPILFNASVFENIAFGVEGATLEKVRQAAEVAHADEFINEMPAGYDTNIGDRGGKLSGGQRQRLSIARAVYKNPPILILDEATSALDTKSERLVQSALDSLMEGRTTIVIAHRLSTIIHADVICVVDGGRIVEQGMHDELLALGGHYAKLHAIQVKS